MIRSLLSRAFSRSKTISCVSSGFSPIRFGPAFSKAGCRRFPPGSTFRHVPLADFPLRRRFRGPGVRAGFFNTALRFGHESGSARRGRGIAVVE